MVIKTTKARKNIIYHCPHIIKPENMATLLELIEINYQEIGDSLGTIIDLSRTEKVTIGALRLCQVRTKGVFLNKPSAIIGTDDSLLMTIGKSIMTLMGSKNTLGFFDSIKEAEIWLDNWYKEQGLDRDSLQGQHQLVQLPAV